MTQVHQCIDRCHTPLAKAQGLVTSELQSFQVSVIHQHTVQAGHMQQLLWHPLNRSVALK